MFTRLPNELIYEIYDYLDYSDIGNLRTTSKIFYDNPVEIDYKKVKTLTEIYNNVTDFKNNKKSDSSYYSYLFTNMDIKVSSQNGKDFVDIELKRGDYTYQFYITKAAYNENYTLLDYLTKMDWNHVTKKIWDSEGLKYYFMKSQILDNVYHKKVRK
jgi:hypothetical protein